MANRACAEIDRRAIRNLGARQVSEKNGGWIELCRLATLGSHVADPLGGKHSSYSGSVEMKRHRELSNLSLSHRT